MKANTAQTQVKKQVVIEPNAIIVSSMKGLNKGGFALNEDATTVGSQAGESEICIPSATLDIWFNPDTFENEI